MTPTERALIELRKRGWTAQVVEHHVRIPARGALSASRFTRDLFGVIDILAIQPGAILGVQVTTVDHQAKRRAKALALPTTARWLAAGGRLSIWGWAIRGKAGKRKLWALTEQEVTAADLPEVIALLKGEVDVHPLVYGGMVRTKELPLTRDNNAAG